jgi:ribosome modulation factor
MMTTESSYDVDATTIVPHQIARDILAQIPACTDQCNTAMRSFAAARTEYRAHLRDRIRHLIAAPAQPLCAVDGTHAVIETLGLTVILLVAVAVRDTTPVAQQTRVVIVPPLEDAEVVAGDLRTRLEVALLACRLRADPNSLHLIDGSLVSVYLTFHRLLRRHARDQRSKRPDWWSGVPDLLDRQALAADWRAVLTSSRVLAHAKRSFSCKDIQECTAVVAPTPPIQSDTLLWSTVLQPGECTHPVPLLTRPPRLTEAFWGWTDDERAAIPHAYHAWRLIYLRPRPYNPALRLEVRQQPDDRLNGQIATLCQNLQVNEIQEPLPQYLADALCRGQQKVAQALVTGMSNSLHRTWSSDMVNLWLGGWRTR